MSGLTFEEFASLAGLKNFREMALETWAKILADPSLSDSMKFEMISESRREGKSTNMLIDAAVASQEKHVVVLVNSEKQKRYLIAKLTDILVTAGYVFSIDNNYFVKWYRRDNEHKIMFMSIAHVQQRLMIRDSVVLIDV